MANGYLGKISAIVSANTADFSSKLNGAAKDVGKFARTVQGDIGSAMRQADRSITSIYTPLQRLERALRAASSMKLSFTGFPGAIRDIDTLKQRLQTGLNDRQISVVLKASGMSSITAFRDAIQSVDSKTFDVIARVGGVEKLKELRKYLIESTGSGGLYKGVKDAEARVAALRSQMAAGAKTARTTTGGSRSEAEIRADLRAEEQRLAALQSSGARARRPASRADRQRIEQQIDDLEDRRATLTTKAVELGNRVGNPANIAALNTTKKQIEEISGQISELQSKLRGGEKLKVSTDDAKKQIKDAETNVKSLKAELKRTLAGGGTATGTADISKELAAAERNLEKQRRLLARKTGVDSATGLSLEQVEAAIPAAQRLGVAPETADRVREALSRSDEKVAADRVRQLAIAARAVNDPLTEVQESVNRMGDSVRARFNSALVQAQKEAQALDTAIRTTEASSKALEGQILAAAAAVAKTRASQQRVTEAESRAQSLRTGQELQFARPGVFGALERSAAVGDAASRLSASSIASNPQLASRLAQIKTLSEQVADALSQLESRRLRGFSTVDAEKKLASLLNHLKHVQGEADREIRIQLDTEEAGQKAEALVAQIKAAKAQASERVEFVITGRPQNLEQARGRQAALESEISGLDRAQRQNFAPMLRRAAELAAVGDLDGQMNELDKIDLELGKTRRLKINDDEARESTRRLKDELEDIASINAPPTLMQRLRDAAKLAGEEVDNVSEELEKARMRGQLASLGPQIEALASLPPDKRAEETSRIIDDIDSVRRQAGARVEIEEDARRRAEVATALLPPILQDESQNISLQGMARPLSPSYLEQVTQRQRQRITGADVEDPQRQISRLLSGTAALKDQAASLSPVFRGQMAASIRVAEQEFWRLRGASNATADGIAAAAAQLRTLEATARRLSAIDVFRRSFGDMRDFFDASRVRQFTGELEAVGNTISAARPGRDRDLAARAAERLARVRAAQLELAEAERGGATFPEERARLDRQARMAEFAVDRRSARAAGISVSEARRRRARGGDVGRMGADGASLALNQLAFAVDDFMSSTGGLEFKLRAISNNITQMAFVLGGTTGLFIGLGAVFAGQLAVGLMKWINNGRTAEDQTKALNDSLARQKSLVEELAQSFASLGDSIRRGTMSAAGEQAADFARQIEDIRKKQSEARRENVAGIDPAVQRERAEQVKLQGQLEKETDIGRRIALEREIESARDREQAAAEAAAARVPAGDEAQSRVRDAMVRIGLARLGPRRGDDAGRAAMEQAVRDRAVADTAAIPVGNTPEDIRAQMAAVSAEIQSARAASIEGSPLGFATAEVASKEILGLEQLLRSLELGLAKAVDDLAVSVVQSSRGPAELIRQAQEEVAKAIQAGLPGARLFQLTLDETAASLGEAYKKLETAASGRDETGRRLTVEDRERLIGEAQSEIESLSDRQATIAAQADALRTARIVDPQVLFESRADRSRSNLSAAGLESGRIARRMREIQAEREQIAGDAALPQNQGVVPQQIFENRLDALNREQAAIEAATIAVKAFSDVLSRAADEAKGNLTSAQQAADEARRADLAFSTPQTQEARRQAEADLERQRELEQKAQTEVAVERDRLEKMATSPEATRIQQIDEQLNSGRDGEALMADRAKAEADLAAAEKEKGPLDEALAAQQAWDDAFEAIFEAEQEMGIGALPIEEKDARLREAGRGDLVDAADAASGEAGKKRRALGIDNVGDAADEELQNRLAAAEERRQQAQARIDEIDNALGGAQPIDRESLIRERAGLQAKMDAEARANGERVSAARDASTQEAERAKMAQRGRELSLTPRARFDQETEAGMESIRQYFGRRAEDEGGLVDFDAQQRAQDRYMRDRERERLSATPEGRGEVLGMTERQRARMEIEDGIGFDIRARAAQIQNEQGVVAANFFMNRAIEQQIATVAPMLEEFNMERKTALLQGPSRARLEVSDVTTTQGRSELNRLLRGDDPAKDVNLAELRKQTDRLDILIDVVKGNPLPVFD